MSNIEKIRQEIERRKGYISVTHFAEELLDFIDSLSDEDNFAKVSKIAEDLEEAAEEYRRKSCNAALKLNVDGPMPEYGGSVKDAFIAGAEWQRNQLKKED